MRCTIAILGLAGALGCRPGTTEPDAAAAGDEPAFAESSILIVTLDTTRRDALGFAVAPDGPRPAAATPALDELAARSVEFTRAFTVAPVTLPAHASLFTGLHPVAHGVHENLGFRLPDAVETLAERLARHGYATAATVAAPAVGPQTGLEQGFASFQGPPRHSGEVERPAREITASALAALAKLVAADRPFLLWAHYFDPHAPYGAFVEDPRAASSIDAAELAATRLAAYLGEVEAVDRELGILLRTARAAAGARDLLTIVVADHGEALGDGGERTHGQTLQDSTLRVPLLFQHPRLPPGRCAQVASVVDLVPTLIEGLGLAETGPLQGRSLLPWLLDPAAREEIELRAVAVETRLPFHEFGWPWLDGATDGRFLWVDRPRPALLELASGAAVVDEERDAPGVARELAAAVAALQRSGAATPPGEGSPASALVQFGYVAAQGDPPQDKSSLPEPEDRAALLELRDRGFAALAAGDFTSALAEFEALRARNTDPSLALLLTAITHSRAAALLPEESYRRQALENALAAWREAARHGPGDGRRHLNVALTLLELERDGEAIAPLRRCLELMPDHVAARQVLARVEVEVARREAALAAGPWRAWLDSPGGELPFGLGLARAAGAIVATIENGAERIAVPGAALEDGALVLSFDHYDSTITAWIAAGGARLDGTWRKRAGPESWAELPFHATAGAAPRFAPMAGEGRVDSIAGKWRVQFETDPDHAVGLFDQDASGAVAGTFLTTTGDYRWLAGRFDSGRLRLSCFDGAHAFLFTAEASGSGELRGDFFSRESWHDTFIAVRDPAVELADPWSQVEWRGGAARLVFPEPDGRRRSLADPAFQGRARVIQVFGSWCPNCSDETRLLVDLDRRFRARGLSILGLAFELTGDLERDSAQVRTFARRHGVEYPLLIAGLSDKEKAGEALPLLDRVKSYPTTIFLHGDGRVARVHSGWTGPATGDAYQRTVEEFTATIESLLREEPADFAEDWGFLVASEWRSAARDGGDGAIVPDPLGSTWTFLARADGSRAVRVVNDAADSAFDEHDVMLTGGAFAIGEIGEEVWVIDREARRLHDALAPERMLTPASGD